QAAGRAVQVAAAQQQLPFEEEQLSVVGIAGAASAASGQGLVGLTEAAMPIGQQGVELTDDGVGGMRPLQAALQQRQRFGSAALLQVVPAEVEQHVGVVGAVAGVELEQAQVALQLAAARGGILVAGVLDDHVGEADVGAAAAQGGQDLFVDAAGPADIGAVAEEANVLDEGGHTGIVGQAEAVEDVGGV